MMAKLTANARSGEGGLVEIGDFVAFYESNYRPMLGYVARRVLDPEVALDLTSEAFAQAFAQRHRYRGSTREESSAWLLRIAQTQVSRYFKRGRVERSAVDRLGVEAPRSSDELCREIEDFAGVDEIRSALRRGFAHLAEGSTAALWLRIVEGRPYTDVARQLGISEPTARARVARTLRRLRERLDDNLDPIGES